MRAVFVLATLPVVLVVTSGCDLSCLGAEHVAEPSPLATFNLSCAYDDTAAVSVTLTGPCVVSANPSYPGLNYEVLQSGVLVWSVNPGVCHVALVFATGFTYSQDVTFAWQTPKCGTPVPVPTPNTFTVNNPSDTCVPPDAGGDAVSDAPADAN